MSWILCPLPPKNKTTHETNISINHNRFIEKKNIIHLINTKYFSVECWKNTLKGAHSKKSFPKIKKLPERSTVSEKVFDQLIVGGLIVESPIQILTIPPTPNLQSIFESLRKRVSYLCLLFFSATVGLVAIVNDGYERVYQLDNLFGVFLSINSVQFLNAFIYLSLLFCHLRKNV